jgi:hypothetical protein
VTSIPNSNSNKNDDMREEERATYVVGVDSSGSPVSSQGQLSALVLFFLSKQPPDQSNGIIFTEEAAV